MGAFGHSHSTDQIVFGKEPPKISVGGHVQPCHIPQLEFLGVGHGESLVRPAACKWHSPLGPRWIPRDAA